MTLDSRMISSLVPTTVITFTVLRVRVGPVLGTCRALVPEVSPAVRPGLRAWTGSFARSDLRLLLIGGGEAEADLEALVRTPRHRGPGHLHGLHWLRGPGGSPGLGRCGSQSVPLSARHGLRAPWKVLQYLECVCQPCAPPSRVSWACYAITANDPRSRVPKRPRSTDARTTTITGNTEMP
jgi:hypothetical protein